MIEKPSILIVEDDENLGFLLKEYLGLEGYKVTLCKDGVTGLSTFKKNSFDVCLLDVMMPNMDGFTLAKKIRTLNDKIPFLFLTARTLKTDRLNAFAIGAEDYITKPFDEEELLCRLKVCLRRQGAIKEQEVKFSIGDFNFDYNLQELCYKGCAQRLTEKENEVLHLLCLNQNKVLRRDEAVEKIYGRKDYFLGRSFDVFVSRLRKMLSRDSRIVIENVFKVGFILRVD
ncbi:MAG: DNA-binding response OmpR family regulator [Polaribacter sp.]|jgi:DNA-binding response OmpR family regulator